MSSMGGGGGMEKREGKEGGGLFSHVQVGNFIYNKTKYCDGTGISAFMGPQKGFTQ